MIKKNNVNNFNESPEMLSSKSDYEYFIKSTIKPIGFGEHGDKVYAQVKERLLLPLYDIVKETGPSFDIEIFYSSIIGDINETFDAVLPSLLQLQRSIHYGEGNSSNT